MQHWPSRCAHCRWGGSHRATNCLIESKAERRERERGWRTQKISVWCCVLFQRSRWLSLSLASKHFKLPSLVYVWITWRSDAQPKIDLFSTLIISFFKPLHTTHTTWSYQSLKGSEREAWQHGEERWVEDFREFNSVPLLRHVRREKSAESSCSLPVIVINMGTSLAAARLSERGNE